MLATYIDINFRVAYSNRDAMSEDVRNVKNLFECIENKDLFLIKYLQKLSKRIITLTNESL